MNYLLVTIAACVAISADSDSNDNAPIASPSPETTVELAAPRLAGADRVVWAVRNRTAIDGADPLEIYYCPRSSEPLPFRPLTGTTIRGSVGKLAAYANSLHVFFDSGAHYRFQIPESAQASRTWSPELRLGDGALPMALTADDDADCLFAIVDAQTAAKLESPKPADGEEVASEVESDGDNPEAPADRDDDGHGNDARAADAESMEPDTAATDKSGPQSSDDRFVLVRYRNREWTWIAPVPIELDGEKPIWIAARAEKIWLLGAMGSTGTTVWSAWDGVQWSEPADMNITLDQVVALMAADKAPAMLTRDSGDSGPGGGAELKPWLLTAGQWQPQSPLSVAGAPLIEPDDDISVSHFGSRIIASWRMADASVQSALWSQSGGDSLIDPHTVTILSIAPTSPQNEQLQVLLGVIVLIALLSVIFARRRESFLVDLPMPPGYELASFHRRLIAFIIDLLIVGLAAYPLILYPWMNTRIDVTADLAEQIDQVKIAVMAEPDAVFWRWMAAASVFVVYGIITEAMFAATIGKMIMGLRVSNDKGRRCSPQAILLRNLLRFIELYPAMQFAPTLIFVLMTRNRQRIGDLVARTVVVERSTTPQPAAPVPPSPDEEKPQDANSDDEQK